MNDYERDLFGPHYVDIKVRGEKLHFEDTEENWRKLGRSLGLMVFKEETGRHNWVLYNPENYMSCGEFLKCYSEENLEAPINCSSCYGMFCDFEFKHKDALKNFDTSGVEDMEKMFYICTMPDGFTLGDKFDTSAVRSMRRMFCGCELPEGFVLGDKFDTSNVEDMTEMFYQCKMPKGFSLEDKLDASSINDDMSNFF